MLSLIFDSLISAALSIIFCSNPNLFLAASILVFPTRSVVATVAADVLSIAVKSALNPYYMISFKLEPIVFKF
jgi:hypothetical protein